jgi:hypothetical protein
VVRVEVDVAVDADPEVVVGSLLGLRKELAELDADAVDLDENGPAPDGTKGVGETANALIVTLSDSAVLVALAGVLRSWVGRDRGRKARMRIGDDEIELSRASEEEQARLAEEWLRRHAQS